MQALDGVHELVDVGAGLGAQRSDQPAPLVERPGAGPALSVMLTSRSASPREDVVRRWPPPRRRRGCAARTSAWPRRSRRSALGQGADEPAVAGLMSRDGCSDQAWRSLSSDVVDRLAVQRAGRRPASSSSTTRRRPASSTHPSAASRPTRPRRERRRPDGAPSRARARRDVAAARGSGSRTSRIMRSIATAATSTSSASRDLGRVGPGPARPTGSRSSGRRRRGSRPRGPPSTAR